MVEITGNVFHLTSRSKTPKEDRHLNRYPKGEQLRNWKGQFGTLHCVNGHDLCYLGTDENCPYCEIR